MDTPQDEPAHLTGAELIGHLKNIIECIEKGDSFQGGLEYEVEGDYDSYAVRGCYRVGNSEGQGGMIIIQTPRCITAADVEQKLSAAALTKIHRRAGIKLAGATNDEFKIGAHVTVRLAGVDEPGTVCSVSFDLDTGRIPVWLTNRAHCMVFSADKLTRTCIIRGSYGGITVDRSSGGVLSLDKHEGYAGEYDDITRFDPALLPEVEGDILDQRFWSATGQQFDPAR